MSIERVEFTVASELVVGHLHFPEGAGPHPAVVVAGPMTSVKEQVTGVYAAALAERGIAALALDHRHYGESGGEPRGYEHWERKVEDLRAALDWLAERAEGRHVLRLSYDERPADPVATARADAARMLGVAIPAPEEADATEWTRVVPAVYSVDGMHSVGEAGSQTGLAAVVAGARELAGRLLDAPAPDPDAP